MVFTATTHHDDVFKRHAENALYADPHISFTTRGGIISGKGLVSDSVEHLDADHLRGKRQLGNLTDIALVPGRVPKHFRATRFDHVSLTAIYMELVAKHTDLSWPMRNAYRLRAHRHDDFIGPAGDALKLVDPVRFDEDRDITRFGRMAGWGWLRSRYRISQDLFFKPNPLLDHLDRLAYLTTDILDVLALYRELPPECRPSEYYAILDILREHPSVFNVWMFVWQDGDHAVISNPDAYTPVARLRALMFSGTYYHPHARVEEHFIGSLLLTYVYRRQEIAPDRLCRMTDDELETWIGHRIGISKWRDVLWEEFWPQVFSFTTREEAESARNLLLSRDPGRTILLEEWRGATKPATDILVEDTGRIVPFREARPEAAAEIEATIAIKTPFRLYSFRIDFAKYPLLQSFVDEYNKQFDP